jgi:hypothetical protein
MKWKKYVTAVSVEIISFAHLRSFSKLESWFSGGCGGL